MLQIVGFRHQGPFISRQTDVGDRGVGNQIQESIEKSQTGAQDGHQNNPASYSQARGDFQRGVARDHGGFQIRRDGRDHQRGNPADPLPKLGRRAGGVSELGQLLGDQRMLDDVEHVVIFEPGVSVALPRVD